MYCYIMLVGCVLFSFVKFGISMGVMEQEYCERSNFSAECGPGEVILMTSAQYGIIKKLKCIKKMFGNPCKTDVLTAVDSWCSGLRKCSFPVMKLTAPEECDNELMRQLLVSYHCVKVEGCHSDSCLDNNPHISLDSSAGTISNYATGCHSNPCTWLLNVKVGQTVNFTMYYFKGRHEHQQRQQQHNGRNTAGTDCHEVGVIGGSTDSRQLEMCTSESKNYREKSFSFKGGDNIQVKLFKLASTLHDDRFLLKYQVLGCPDYIHAAEGMETIRNTDTIEVRCTGTRHAWKLNCVGSSWVGEIGSCNSVFLDNKDGSGEGSSSLHKVTSSPSGMLIVVCIGLAIGIVLGMCLLTIVMIYMKRRRNQPYEYPTVGAPPLHEQSTYCPYMEKPVLIQESDYQCTHTRPTKCAHKRPDTKGFRPIPEGETMEDVFDEHLDNNPVGMTITDTCTTLRPCVYEKPLVDKTIKISRQKSGL